MTTVWAFYSLLQWIISYPKKKKNEVVLFKLALDKKYNQFWACPSSKWLNAFEISGGQLFIIFMVAWMWWLMSWSESEEQTSRLLQENKSDGQCTRKKKETGVGPLLPTQ